MREAMPGFPVEQVRRHVRPTILALGLLTACGQWRRVGVQPRISEHRRILSALRKHDSKGARKAMRDHLARVIDGLLAATETDAIEVARTQAVRSRHEYSRRLAI